VVEVFFPEARLLASGRHGRKPQYGTLFLKRGIPRSSDWYAWWDATRRSSKAVSRDIVVTLLDESGADVQRWLLCQATPVSYALSSLNAMGNEPLMETLELTVGGFDAAASSQGGSPRRGRSRTRA